MSINEVPSKRATEDASVAKLAMKLEAVVIPVANAAHGHHEKRSGQRDANWSDWYAAYLAAEQAGKQLRQ
jgi:hypothetical protein